MTELNKYVYVIWYTSRDVFSFFHPDFLSHTLFMLLILMHLATGNPDLKFLLGDQNTLIRFWSVLKTADWELVACVISIEDHNYLFVVG